MWFSIEFNGFILLDTVTFVYCINQPENFSNGNFYKFLTFLFSLYFRILAETKEDSVPKKASGGSIDRGKRTSRIIFILFLPVLQQQQNMSKFMVWKSQDCPEKWHTCFSKLVVHTLTWSSIVLLRYCSCGGWKREKVFLHQGLGR